MSPMKPRLLLISCATALAFMVAAQAENPDQRPDQRPDQPNRPGPHPPAPPVQRHHDGPPQHRDSQKRDGDGDIRARLNHLNEAIQHLRSAGINEPAEHLEKMAREMREQSHRQQQGSDGRPQMDARAMEDMKREIRNLSTQVQELRNMIQNRRPDELRQARPAEPRPEGERRVEGGGNQPLRPDGPPQGDRRPHDGDQRRDGDRGRQQRDNPPGEPRKDSPRDDGPRAGGPPDQPRREAPALRPEESRDKPRDESRRDDASAGPGRPPGPSGEDRERYMALSDKGKEKFRQEMMQNREKLMSLSPEERQKHAKEFFEKIQAEEKAQKQQGTNP
jgi:hypothetical protein